MRNQGNGFKDFIANRAGLLCASLSSGVAKGGCYGTISALPDVADIDGDGIPEIISPKGALHKVMCYP